MNSSFFNIQNKRSTVNVTVNIEDESGQLSAYPIGLFNPDGKFIGVAYNKNEVKSIWNKKCSSIGVIKTTQSDYTFTLALNSTSINPQKIPAKAQTSLGNIINEQFSGTSLNNFTVSASNSTISEVSNNLSVSKSSGGQFDDIVKQTEYGYSQLEDFSIASSVQIKNISSVSKGVGIGIYGANSGAAQYHVLGYIIADNINQGNLYLDYGTTSGYVHLSSETATSFTINIDDWIDYTFTRSGWTYSVTATNRTTSVTKTCSYTFPTVNVTYLMPNIFYYNLWLMGGNQLIDSFIVSSSIKNFNKVGFLGDSITQGFDSGGINSRAASLMKARLINDYDSVILAGNFNTADNLKATIKEILSVGIDTVILLIGTNDIGINVNGAKGSYTQLVNTLLANNINVQTLTIPSRAGYSSQVNDFNSWLSVNYPNIIDFKTAVDAGNGNDGDGIHLNTAGHLIESNVISSIRTDLFI